MTTLKSKFLILFLCCSAFSFLSLNNADDLSPAVSPDDLIGVWLNKKGTLKVQVEKIDNKYFGKLVWLQKTLDASGKTKTDFLNPKKELRTKPLLGLKVLSDLEYDHDNIWESGKIYDPESGNSYSCRIKMITQKILVVRGYIFIPLIGRDEVCYRVEK